MLLILNSALCRPKVIDAKQIENFKNEEAHKNISEITRICLITKSNM